MNVLRVRIAALAMFFASACCSSLPKLGAKQDVLETPSLDPRSPKITREVWHDAKRDRDVPVTIYAPADAHNARVVVFSHGIGEDRDSYAYLGDALARAGFLAVHVTHAGTDRAVLERGYRFLYRAVKQKENWVNRPLDVSFVLDHLGAKDAAVVGHSAGAFTVLALAGMRMTDGSLRDPRVTIGVAMSMPRMDGVVPPGGYETLAIPVLHLTGTCDTSLIYRTFPKHRRIPYESTHAQGQVLVTMEGVNHNTFVESDSRNAAIAKLVIAFLRGDPWFEEAGMSQVDGVRVSVERNSSAR